MLKRYFYRIRKFLRNAFGESYHHVDQSPGKCYVADQLSGYFNNLTAKADWRGPTGEFGVPMITTDTAPSFAFPITIFQWALGHWDLWILSGRKADEHLQSVLGAAGWAVSALTPEGGWKTWTHLKRPVISPFSAMSQGEGLSLLVRAASVEPASGFDDAARRAFEFLTKSGYNPLMSEVDGRDIPQEYPGTAFSSVLNGAIFALAGIKDYAIYTRDPAVATVARGMAANLASIIDKYDVGYWSNYDLSGNIASPFYHRLHISQLTVLARMFPEHSVILSRTRDRFLAYQGALHCRIRSLIVKILQKLRDTDVGEIA